uniref:Uncharacterized protein n=1 Tax=Nomascus leucogenys TaxID=61853 RepID=G1SB91_NOMLE
MVDGMDPHTFSYNFNNRPILSRRNTVWLCYEVKTKDPSRPRLDTEIFRGKVPRSLIRAPFQVLGSLLGQCPAGPVASPLTTGREQGR